MSAQESTRQPSNAPLWIMVVLCAALLVLFVWSIREDLPAAPITITVPTAAVQPQAATPPVVRSLATPAPIPQPAPQSLSPAEQAVPTPVLYYPSQDAANQAADRAYADAIKALPENQPAVKEDRGGWCSGSRADDPICTNPKGSKEAK